MEGNDGPDMVYDVPALDAAGQPVTLRLRPNPAVVTLEALDAAANQLSKFHVSITRTGQFASFFGACTHAAKRWPDGAEPLAREDGDAQ